jgi:hypothetical protein
VSDELERLKRLRNRQLADRNPMVQQEHFQGTYLRKESKARSKRYTLREAWQTIPHVYRSPLIGSVLGICIIVFLPLIWNSVWAFWTGVFATVFLIILGVLVGQALDVRDNLRDYSKH